jgi:hypothetical protein
MSYLFNVLTLISVGCVELDVVFDAFLFAQGEIYFHGRSNHRTNSSGWKISIRFSGGQHSIAFSQWSFKKSIADNQPLT